MCTFEPPNSASGVFSITKYHHRYPPEDARAQDAYGVGKEFAYHHENTGGRTTLVLIRDRLGYWGRPVTS